MTRFIVVPQWQGSASSRAMTLVDGAEAIAGDLPRSATHRVEVPIEAGETLGTGIRRYSSLARTHAAIRDAWDENVPASADAHSPEAALVVGGDCSVAIAAISAAARRHPDLAVVWLDAHADLHTPATSASGALGGMALRAVVETGPLGGAALDPSRVVLAGARDIDTAESDYLASSGIRSIGVDDLHDPAALATAVAATGAGTVFVHVDLDVLDPAAVTGVASPVPFGLDVATLTAAVGVLRERMPLAGASLAGFAPASPAAAVEDLGAILRVVGALA